ncbi:MAG TPA: PRTRC system protein E [Burkholderiales bacterium]|nr:PRTRC system protein E [Burkholderiales bacterium]
MFRELFPIARHTALNFIVTPQGDALKVIIIPKPTDKAEKNAALTAPLTITGTPEELDTLAEDVAEQLRAQYLEPVNAIRAKLSLPTDAVNSALDKPARKPAAEKKAEKPKAPAAPKAAKPAKAAAKPAKPAKTAKPAGPAAAKAKKPTKARHPKLSPQKPKIDQATEAQCLEEGKQYRLLIGEAKPSRVLFIRWAKTGRRFEKFHSAFQKFMDLCKPPEGAAENPPAPEPRADQAALDIGSGDEAQTQRTVMDPSSKWPFPTGNTGDDQRNDSTKGEADASVSIETVAKGSEAELNETLSRMAEERAITEKAIIEPPPPPKPVIRPIFTDTGTLLASTGRTWAEGEKYSHPEFGDYRIAAVTIERITVIAWTDEAPTASAANLTLEV